MDDDPAYLPDSLALALAIARQDEGAAVRILDDLIEMGDVRRALRQLAGLLVNTCEDLDRAVGRDFAALPCLCEIGAEVEAEESSLAGLAEEVW